MKRQRRPNAHSPGGSRGVLLALLDAFHAEVNGHLLYGEKFPALATWYKLHPVAMDAGITVEADGTMVERVPSETALPRGKDEGPRDVAWSLRRKGEDDNQDGLAALARLHQQMRKQISSASPDQVREYIDWARRGTRQKNPVRTTVTLDEAAKVARKLRVSDVSIEALRKGMIVELEHADVTGGDLLLTGRIVLAHLRERGDYYELLEKYVEPPKKNPSPQRKRYRRGKKSGSVRPLMVTDRNLFDVLRMFEGADWVSRLKLDWKAIPPNARIDGERNTYFVDKSGRVFVVKAHDKPTEEAMREVGIAPNPKKNPCPCKGYYDSPDGRSLLAMAASGDRDAEEDIAMGKSVKRAIRGASGTRRANPAARENPGMSYLDRLVKHYGVTDDPLLGAFLLPDGTFLDFSEGSGQRIQDHRNITFLLPKAWHQGEIQGRWYRYDGMAQIAKQVGMYRWFPENWDLEAWTPPTLEQRRVIRELAQMHELGVEAHTDQYAKKIMRRRQFKKLYYPDLLRVSDPVVDLLAFFRGEDEGLEVRRGNPASRPVQGVEQCAGCGAEVVLKRKYGEGETVLCSRCRRAARKAKPPVVLGKSREPSPPVEVTWVPTWQNRRFHVGPNYYVEVSSFERSDSNRTVRLVETATSKPIAERQVTAEDTTQSLAAWAHSRIGAR